MHIQSGAPFRSAELTLSAPGGTFVALFDTPGLALFNAAHCFTAAEKALAEALDEIRHRLTANQP